MAARTFFFPKLDFPKKQTAQLLMDSQKNNYLSWSNQNNACLGPALHPN